MTFRLVAYFLGGAVIIFGVANNSMAEELSKSLPKVELALKSLERILVQIDVSMLSVQYREGKYMENSKTRMLTYIQSSHKDRINLSNEVRMYDLLLL